MKRLKKPLLYALLAFFVGSIFTFLDEPKIVELKGAIIGGAKYAIIVFFFMIIIDKLSFKLD